MLPGIDISYSQGTTPALGGQSFVFVRATFRDKVDSRWTQHSAAVRAAGKPLGAYHFLYLTPSVGDQVAAFLATAAGADVLALDVEGEVNTAAGRAMAQEFIAQVHAAGRKIGLYHSLSGFPNIGQDFNWIAAWGSTAPSTPWAFWQYTSSPFDHDKFNGDAAALAAFVTSQKGDVVRVYEKLIQSGSFKVTAGKVAVALRLDAATGEWLTGAQAASGIGRYDYVLHRIAGDGAPTYAVHIASGLFAGFFINSGSIDQTADPVAPTTLTQADLLAAKQAQYDLDKKSVVAEASLSNPRPV